MALSGEATAISIFTLVHLITNPGKCWGKKMGNMTGTTQSVASGKNIPEKNHLC
jgi:hypothetical protein